MASESMDIDMSPPADDSRSGFENHNYLHDGNKNENRNVITRTAATVNITSHVLIAGLTLYFIYVSFKSYYLFSWHPACATIGSLTLTAQAIMAMSQDNVLVKKLSRHGRVRTHWILLALASGCIFASFLVIVTLKNARNRDHFVSSHAIIGLLSVILVAFTSCGGVSALFSMRLKKLVKPATVKLAHNIVGIITFGIGIICLITGVYTHFFNRSAGFSSQVICTILLILASILTLKSALKSGYGRFRSLS